MFHFTEKCDFLQLFESVILLFLKMTQPNVPALVNLEQGIGFCTLL